MILKSFGNDLKIGLKYWADPLKKSNASAKAEKGLIIRPSNYVKWVNTLKSTPGT